MFTEKDSVIISFLVVFPPGFIGSSVEYKKPNSLIPVILPEKRPETVAVFLAGIADSNVPEIIVPCGVSSLLQPPKKQEESKSKVKNRYTFFIIDRILLIIHTKYQNPPLGISPPPATSYTDPASPAAKYEHESLGHPRS